MKKAALILITALSLFSCNDSTVSISYTNDDEGNEHKKMIVRSLAEDMDAEINGNAEFNDEGTAIQMISKGGSVFYRDDNREMTAVNKEGKIKYSLKINGNKLSADSREGKVLIADAVKQLKKLDKKTENTNKPGRQQVQPINHQSNQSPPAAGSRQNAKNEQLSQTNESL